MRKWRILNVNGKQLLEKMDLVDPKFIEDADKLPRRKPIMWQAWFAAAACLALTVLSGFMLAATSGDAYIPVESPGETASIFGGALPLVLLGVSLLAAVGIIAYIFKKRR